MTFTRHFSVAELMPYISWGYFFHAWSLNAGMASIAQVHTCTACQTAWINRFDAENRGQAESAVTLWNDARRQLQQWAREGRSAVARVMIERAWSEDEDIVLPDLNTRLPLLRQQTGTPCLCLSDFVAPKESSIDDKIALFATTTEAEMEQSMPDDPYRHLLAQTLADRLAEAAAELAHMLTRRQWWGYAPDETLSADDILSARYRGIRPAVGYPSLPDQSLNFLFSSLLNFADLGITLTESGAMRPHASTSGLMLAHAKARYFSVGNIGEDQLHDYARRRGMKSEELQRFLQTVIA